VLRQPEKHPGDRDDRQHDHARSQERDLDRYAVEEFCLARLHEAEHGDVKGLRLSFAHLAGDRDEDPRCPERDGGAEQDEDPDRGIYVVDPPLDEAEGLEERVPEKMQMAAIFGAAIAATVWGRTMSHSSTI
jgi:hypothetical protein